MTLFLAYVSLFWISFLAATVLPLGSEWLVAVMAGKGHNLWAVVAVAGTGNTMGAITTYALGRWGGAWWWKRFSSSPEKQKKAEALFLKYGAWTMLLAWAPVIGDPLCVVAGVFKMPVAAFTFMAAVGKFGRYAVIAYTTARVVS